MGGMTKKVQAKDISDEAFLAAIDATKFTEGGWTSWSKVTEHLAIYPAKVVLAKANSLIKRKVIGGCGCGCRGDFHYPPQW